MYKTDVQFQHCNKRKKKTPTNANQTHRTTHPVESVERRTSSRINHFKPHHPSHRARAIQPISSSKRQKRLNRMLREGRNQLTMWQIQIKRSHLIWAVSDRPAPQTGMITKLMLILAKTRTFSSSPGPSKLVKCESPVIEVIEPTSDTEQVKRNQRVLS